jgi:hypothetical protein
MKTLTIEIANQMAESYGTEFVPATIRTDIFVLGRTGKLHRTRKGLASDAEMLELAQDKIDRGFSVEQSPGRHLFLWI